MRILVVEDEEAIREIVVELCQGISGDVSEAKNGMEALELLRLKSFDLLVSDYQMPKMSGLDLLQVCKAENIRVPTIWLSGRDNPELKIYAWQFGLFDYLEKPFDVEDFRKSIQMVASLDQETKNAFFADYSSEIFNIPHSMISKKIEKATLRSFFEYCQSEKVNPTEMASLILKS